MTTTGGVLTTTERSVHILDTIQELESARATQIADELDLATSTVHKHLQTLTALELVRKQDQRYYIGFRLLNLGETARTTLPISGTIVECLQELAQATGEEVDFFVGSSGRAITVYESYDSTNPYQHDFADPSDNYWRTGTYYHLHSIAPGKAILAQLPDRRITEIIRKYELPSIGPNTITSEHKLWQEIEEVRQEGYATSDEEYARGLCGIAKALHIDSGLEGAIGISVPAYRFDQTEFINNLKSELNQVVTKLEEELETERGETNR